MSAHNIDFMKTSAKLSLNYTPVNCVCGWVYCFHVVHPNEQPSDRPNECVSVTFCFLNNFKNH